MPGKYGPPPPEVKPAKPTPKKFVDWSDWPRQYAIHKERDSRAGVVVLRASEVSLTIEGGSIVGIYNRDTHGSKHFIANDGPDVLACIPELSMVESIILPLASMHIAGRNTECSSPDEVDVKVNSQRMEDGDWAIHLHAKDSSNI